MGSAEIWYLGHSGFAVRTSRHLLIFDYYLDTPDKQGRGLDAGVVTPADLKGTDTAVFVSHHHPDHYNPVIFDFRKYAGSIRFILSDDVRRAPKAEDTVFVHPGKTYELPGIHIETLRSTDVGVAFVVETDGIVIYHAGDLNWWHWEGEPETDNRRMAERYQAQISLLRGRNIDLAFIPADPRLESASLSGLNLFMAEVGAEKVFPMHFWDHYDIFRRIAEDPLTVSYRAQIAVITRRGEKFRFSKDS